jgi:hypothetical protein
VEQSTFGKRPLTCNNARTIGRTPPKFDTWGGRSRRRAAETLDTYSHLWPDSDDRTREAVDLVLAGLLAD